MVNQRLASPDYISEHLDALAQEFHRWFVTSIAADDNPWGFRPELWPAGPVENRDSAAFFLNQLNQWGANFFLTGETHNWKGIAVTVCLRRHVLDDPRYQLEQFGAKEGDLYFSVYGVAPEHRGRGIAKGLLDASIKHLKALAPQPPTFWVRTHADHTVRVIAEFERRGFSIAGRYEVQQFGNTTKRVVMSVPTSQLHFRD